MATIAGGCRCPRASSPGATASLPRRRRTRITHVGRSQRETLAILPPNIVFILADDIGYADLSCYGRRDFSTPNIDRIAERGMRFTAGLRQLRRVLGDADRADHRPLPIPPAGRPRRAARGKTDVGLPPEHPTLPSLLRKAGYATTLVGKWHLGVLPAFGPLQSGYDHFCGLPRRRARLLLAHATHAANDDLWDGDVADRTRPAT